MMLPSTVRIMLATESVDFRNGFDGLAGLVRESLGEDPQDGSLYVFRNKSGDKVKVLFASRQGLCLFAKRLEKGRFKFPSSDEATMEIESADLAVLLEGLELSERRRRPARVAPAVALR
jgi:transposase